MAQFFTDFSEYAHGYKLTGYNHSDGTYGDWRNRWDIYTKLTALDEAGATGGRIAQATSTDTEIGLFTWDAVDGGGLPGADLAEAEIVCRLRANVSTNVIFSGVLRGNGVRFDPDGYVGGCTKTDALVRRENAGGTGSSYLSISSHGYTRPQNGWYWFRMQARGTTVRVRIWEDGTPEPSTWPSEVTDNVWANGWIGLPFFAGYGFPVEFDLVGIGTDGDAAPTEALATEPDPVSADVNRTLPAATASKAATSTVPNSDASVGGPQGRTLPAASTTMEGAVAVPASSASTERTLPAASTSIEGAVVAPGATATLERTLPAASSSTSVDAEPPPARSGAVSRTLPAAGSQLAAEAVVPTYEAQASRTLPAATSAKAGTSLEPQTGVQVNRTLPALVKTVDGYAVRPPDAEGSVSRTLPAPTSSKASLSTAPGSALARMDRVLGAASSGLTGELSDPPGMSGALQRTLPAPERDLQADVELPVISIGLVRTLPAASSLLAVSADGVDRRFGSSTTSVLAPVGSSTGVTAPFDSSTDLTVPITSSTDVRLVADAA
jgi:hypothetical protein